MSNTQNHPYIPANLVSHRVLGKGRIEPSEYSRQFKNKEMDKLMQKVYLN